MLNTVLLLGFLAVADSQAQETQEDELDFLLATLQEDVSPPNLLYGMGIVSGATETKRWESRSRYRVSDRVEPGFETTHPRLHDYTEFVNRFYYKLNHAEQGWNSSNKKFHQF